MPSEGPWGYFPMGYKLLSAALQSSAITELPGDVLSSVLWGLCLSLGCPCTCACVTRLICWGSGGFSVNAFGWRSPLVLDGWSSAWLCPIRSGGNVCSPVGFCHLWGCFAIVLCTCAMSNPYCLQQHLIDF